MAFIGIPSAETRMKRVPLWLADGIPFYLISAACMLGGCLALNNSLSWMDAPALHDIILIAQLNVYEVALIALAWLLVRRRQVHDGLMLAGIEVFFLVDASFLNAQLATCNLALGLVVNIVLFFVAVAKIAFLARIAGLHPRDGRLAATMAQLAMLFAIPVIFRRFDGGDLPAGLFYGASWAAGVLIPASIAVSRHGNRAAAAPPALNGIVRLLCVLPWISLLLHMGMLHWVYNVHLYSAELTPLLLGLTCALYHVRPSGFISRGQLIALQWFLPAVAVLISLGNPFALCFVGGKNGRFQMTPEHLGIAGAYLVYIYCFARRHAARFLVLGAVAEFAVMFGPSAQDLGNAVSRSWSVVYRAAWSLVPKTVVQAGVAAIIAAFAFLGIGAITSFLRTPSKSEEPNESTAAGSISVEP